MKSSLFVLLCSGLLALVAGFTKDDHEIFRLRDEIQASEGSEVTFYGKHRRVPKNQTNFLLTYSLSLYRFLGGQAQRFSRRHSQSLQEEIQDHTS